MLDKAGNLDVGQAGNLKEWDVRFSHMAQLIELQPVLDSAASVDVRVILDSYLQEIEQQRAALAPKRSYVLGGILTILSTLVVSILRTYGDQIVSVLGNMVGLNTG